MGGHKKGKRVETMRDVASGEGLDRKMAGSGLLGGWGQGGVCKGLWPNL